MTVNNSLSFTFSWLSDFHTFITSNLHLEIIFYTRGVKIYTSYENPSQKEEAQKW